VVVGYQDGCCALPDSLYKDFRNLSELHTVCKGLVHEPYGLGFFFLNLKVVGDPLVSIHVVGRELSLCEALAPFPLDVLADRQAFLLCVGGQDRQLQLPVRGERIDVFPFKADRYAPFLQMPYGLQEVDSIAGITAD